MRGMMRAAVVTGPGQVPIDRVPIPEPAAGGIRLRIEGCGVCASNLTPWSGLDWMRFPTAPGEPGHEALSQRAYAEYDLAAADAVLLLPASLDGQAAAPSRRTWLSL
jgi:hypothetical protein